MMLSIIDDVHKSVLRNGAKWIINADEFLARVINVPRTILRPPGVEHPPMIRSPRSRKEAFTVIFATGSGVRFHPAVVIPADKHPRAMRLHQRSLTVCLSYVVIVGSEKSFGCSISSA